MMGVPSERTRIVRLALACAAVALAARPAAAAERDEAGARVLFREARRLVDAGNYAEACPKFEDSLRLDPGVGTNFNLADCYEHIGRTASAWARFLDVAAVTRVAGQDERERVARTRAEALEPKLVRLTLSVTSPMEGMVVERDHVTVPSTIWGMAVPIDPGQHVLEARAPGRRPWSSQLTVPDTPTTITVTVPPLSELPAATAASVPPAPPVLPVTAAEHALNPPVQRWTVPVIALGSVATLATVTGVVFALRTRAENEEAKTLCARNICPSTSEKLRHEELLSNAGRDRTVAYLGAGIGAASLVAAAYLWLRPSRPAPQASTVRVSGAPLGALGAQLEVMW